MKKDRLRQIKEKAQATADGIRFSTGYQTVKDIKAAMRQDSVQEKAWMKKRDGCAEFCGLTPDADGFYDYDKIDMKNPLVELEYFLCNPKNLAQTSAHLPKEQRDRYLRQHLSEDAVALFWDPSIGAKWDRSGTPYNWDRRNPYYARTFKFGDVRRSLGLGRIKAAMPGTDDDAEAVTGGDKDAGE